MVRLSYQSYLQDTNQECISRYKPLEVINTKEAQTIVKHTTKNPFLTNHYFRQQYVAYRRTTVYLYSIT